jgi:hypothetical protein
MAGDLCYKFDENGLIYREELNGSRGYGDSCAESMRYFHLIYSRAILLGNASLPAHAPRFKDLMSVMANYFVSPTQIVRAPVHLLPPEWPDPISDIPGDQTNPMMLCLGITGFEDIRDPFFNVHYKRLRYQNGNLMTPHAFNIMRRSKFEKPSSFLDYGLYGTVLARCGYLPFWDAGKKAIEFGNPDDVADDINLIHCFLQAEYRGTTSVSKKALEKYKRDRVESLGTTELGFNKKLMGAVAWYYKTSPWLTELYEPMVNYLYEV